MKVFISWSGETSKAIAETLRNWLPSVVQAIKPYYSPDDITKGSRWSIEISKELEECKVGLLCLTADNLEAPWVMFEAGALSKSLSAARVCPLLFGVDPSDIKGPLVQFQAAPFARDEMKKAVRMMNQELGASALAPDVLDSVFDMWWPKLEGAITAILSKAHAPSKHRIRSERDILDEILARVRVTSSDPSRSPISPDAVQDLLSGLERLEIDLSHRHATDCGDLHEIVATLRKPIEHIARKTQHEINQFDTRKDLFEPIRTRFASDKPPTRAPTSDTPLDSNKPPIRKRRVK